jgi:hypothetical protein
VRVSARVAGGCLMRPTIANSQSLPAHDGHPPNLTASTDGDPDPLDGRLAQLKCRERIRSECLRCLLNPIMVVRVSAPCRHTQQPGNSSQALKLGQQCARRFLHLHCRNCSLLSSDRAGMSQLPCKTCEHIPHPVDGLTRAGRSPELGGGPGRSPELSARSGPRWRLCSARARRTGGRSWSQLAPQLHRGPVEWSQRQGTRGTAEPRVSVTGALQFRSGPHLPKKQHDPTATNPCSHSHRPSPKRVPVQARLWCSDKQPMRAHLRPPSHPDRTSRTWRKPWPSLPRSLC